VWDYITQFGSFNSYKHFVKGDCGGMLIDLPFTMSMFHDLLGLDTPEHAQIYFADIKAKASLDGDTVESWCLSNIGPTLYEKCVRHYTERQWGRKCSELPKSIIQRLPLRFTYDTTYFRNAKFQGMPIAGYSRLINRMIDCEGGSPALGGFNSEVLDVGLPFLQKLSSEFDHVFFSGELDRLFGYDSGVLEYRSLKFSDNRYDTEFALGAPVINNLNAEGSHSRLIEHKMFYPELKSDSTIVTTEYPDDWAPGKRAYYPVRTEDSVTLHADYLDRLHTLTPNVIAGGRLGSFQYLDMDQAIAMAMKDASIL
jgi:UDP-galactopyranose mutase